MVCVFLQPRSSNKMLALFHLQDPVKFAKILSSETKNTMLQIHDMVSLGEVLCD